MIGRCTHIVDCRETRGLGEGGGIAQRGTFAECGSDVLAVAMSPGRRHITKPVCEITFGLREANLLTSTMILNAGSGVPHDAPSGGSGNAFGLSDKEVEQMQKFKVIVVHLGGVRNHITYKARLILRNVNKPCVIICEYPVDFEDFAKIGVKTALVGSSKGTYSSKKISDIYTFFGKTIINNLDNITGVTVLFNGKNLLKINIEGKDLRINKLSYISISEEDNVYYITIKNDDNK